jgi:hypothetical protein
MAGSAVWPYPQRHWKAEHGTPFKRIPGVLRREYGKCSSSSGISGLRFTPMLEATLRDNQLTQVQIDTQIDGQLSRMSKRDDTTALVRKEDVHAPRLLSTTASVQQRRGTPSTPRNSKPRHVAAGASGSSSAIKASHTDTNDGPPGPRRGGPRGASFDSPTTLSAQSSRPSTGHGGLPPGDAARRDDGDS